MNNLQEDILVQAICSHLDASITQLDPAIETRLDSMREAALASQSRVAESNPAATEAALVQNVRSRLQEIPALDPAIKSRLDAARRQAVSRLQQRQSSPLQTLLAQAQYQLTSLLSMTQTMRPANMVATACVMVTVVSLFYVSSRPTGTLPLEDELVLIASADDIELYENLDFYLWLAENGLPN